MISCSILKVWVQLKESITYLAVSTFFLSSSCMTLHDSNMMQSISRTMRCGVPSPHPKSCAYPINVCTSPKRWRSSNIPKPTILTFPWLHFVRLNTHYATLKLKLTHFLVRWGVLAQCGGAQWFALHGRARTSSCSAVNSVRRAPPWMTTQNTSFSCIINEIHIISMTTY